MKIKNMTKRNELKKNTWIHKKLWDQWLFIVRVIMENDARKDKSYNVIFFMVAFYNRTYMRLYVANFIIFSIHRNDYKSVSSVMQNN